MASRICAAVMSAGTSRYISSSSSGTSGCSAASAPDGDSVTAAAGAPDAGDSPAAASAGVPASGKASACSWKRPIAVWMSFTERGPLEANSITFNTRLRSKAMRIQ